MKKNTIKIIGLFFLLTISFIYTEKVFTISRNNDPLMKRIIKYKEENDSKPVNAIINNDEIIIGLSGNYIHPLDSYKNMKEEDIFSEDKIIKYKQRPKNTINENFDYYITSSNKIEKKVYIILKITNKKDLSYINSFNNNFSLFINEEILNKYYIDTNLEVYNLTINSKLKEINKIIEENYNKALFCLNENKNQKFKLICKKNKMYSIKPTLVNPSLEVLKENLENGIIISYNLNEISTNQLNVVVNVIETKGYKIDKLSNLIKE